MITSLPDEVGKTRKRGQIKDFEVAYRRLNDFVDKINDKILNRLQLFQEVYYGDYKEQVALMSEELKNLRANFDSEVLYQKSNEKMYLLEEERDFFRAQVMKLNQEVNKYIDDNKNLKRKIVDLESEVSNYKTITFNFEKRLQKLQFERTQMAIFKPQQSASSLPKMQNDQSERVNLIVQHQTLQPKLQVSHSRTSFFERKGPPKVRSRTYSKIESATKASIRKYEEANERDHIIDECLKQVKRQIFYRNSQQKNSSTPFQQISKVNFDKFTRTDKKSMIVKLLNNEKLVDEFGDFLTSRNSADALSRMMKTKVADEKFNQKFLNDLKRSFNKKMFDLKTKPASRQKRQLQIE